VEVHSCNPNPQKAKAENFKYSMGYTVETPSQKKKKKKEARNYFTILINLIVHIMNLIPHVIGFQSIS
jgi:hypothetical protein